MTNPTDVDEFRPEERLAVLVDRVSKVYCRDFEGTRLNIARALLRGGRRRRTLEPGEFFAVREVSFLVPKGGTFVVFGTRSSGKSTLARMVCGVLPVDRGTVHVSGRPQYLSGALLGGNVFMRAGEYVDLAATLAGVPSHRIREVREDVLAFCDLADAPGRPLGDLPRAIVRMMSLCSCLHSDADLLVFDDVFGGQGPRLARWMARVERSLETRTGVVFTGTTTNVPECANHGAVLHDGRILFYGSTSHAAAIFRELQDEIGGRLTVPPMTPARRKFLSRFPNDLPLLAGLGAAPPFGHSASALAEMDLAEPAGDARVQPRVSALRRRLTIEHDSWAPTLVKDEVARLAGAGRPIVAGPWLGDSGSELLYWVPFLTWVVEQGGIARDRIIALTDGGAVEWYRHAASRTYDVADVLDPSALAGHVVERAQLPKLYKQRLPTWREQRMAEAAARCAGVEEFDVLHPMFMHRMVWLALWRSMPVTAAMDLCVHRAIDPPRSTGLEWLPESFVAARFEDSPFLNYSDRVRWAVSAQVRTIAAHLPVVMLSDDRGGQAFDGVPNLHFLSDHDTHGRRRAALETAVIARAASVVGNFFGLAFAAPYVGAPALTFHGGYTGSRLRHVEAARILFRGAPAPFSVMDVAELGADGSESTLAWNWVRQAMLRPRGRP